MTERSAGNSSANPSSPYGPESHSNADGAWPSEILESLADPVVAFDREYRYTFVSRRAAEALGKTRDELIGRRMWDIFPEDADTGFQEACERAWSERKPVTVERYSKVLDRWLESYVYPFENGAATQWRDITERKRDERELRAGEERFRTLFNSMQEGFALCEVILDATGKPVDWRYLDVNPAFEVMFGRKRGELIGCTYREAYPAVASDFWISALGQVALSREPANLDGPGAGGKSYQAIAYSPRAGQFAAIFSDVTDRKLADEELSRQKQQYEALAENAPEVIARFDRDLRHIYINDYGSSVYGISKSEIIGKTNAELGFPEETVAFWTKRFEEVFASGCQQTVDFEFRSPNFGHQHFSAMFVPEMDSHGRVATVLAITRDVTPLRRAEEALRASERQLKAVIENLAEGLIVFDPAGKSLQWNRAALLMHEYDHQEAVLGRLGDLPDLYELRALDGRVLELDEWPIVRVVNGEPVRDYELVVHHKKRRWERSFSYNGVMISDESGAPWLGLLSIRDITDRRSSEERLRQAQKLESLGLLAGGIAHDFNNLLTGIMGNASMVLDEVSGDSAEHLTEVIASAERAAGLTRQLLAYSGKGQFVVRDLDVSEAVHEIGGLVQFSIPKSVSLSLNVQQRLPSVRMDPGQLQQVLMNLVINAGEAIGEGNPGRIAISTSMVDIAAPFTDAAGHLVPPGRYVAVEVSDTGRGISEEDKSKIFDPFFSTKFTGRGLGLAAVAGIIRAQKGAITLDSGPGRGAAFRVLFRAADEGRRTAEAVAGEPRATLLVVDDEMAVRDFISAVLRRRGYRVLAAADGREALAAVDLENNAVNAAIIDIVMPLMGAGDLAPALLERIPGIRILLTSGYSETEARRLCAAYPGAAFIQKPYTAQQIAEAVEEILSADRR